MCIHTTFIGELIIDSCIIWLKSTGDLSITCYAAEQWLVLPVGEEPGYLDVDVPFVHDSTSFRIISLTVGISRSV